MRRAISNRYGIALAVVVFSSLMLVVLRPMPVATQNTPAVTIFEGARLITGDGSAALENSAFIVTGNRFTQVGRAGQLQAPAGARRVDLRGKTVIPAIIDTHTH